MTHAPLRPDLWQITLPAVKAARAKGLEYVASGGYVAGKNMPRYRVNDQGWSTTTSDDALSEFRKGAPPDWDYMFGPKRGSFAAIAVDEVPELRDAAEQVSQIALSDERFAACISFLAHAKQSVEERKGQIEFEYVRFVTDIVARAEAVGAASDDDLLNIYLRLERARFAEVLKGDLLVPLALTALDHPGVLQITDRISIESLDEATQQARAESAIYGGKVSAYVIAAATHAVIVKDVTIANTDWGRRRFGHDYSNLDVDLASVDRVIQCVHIATGYDTGYAQIVVRPTDWADDWVHDLPPISKIDTVHRYPDKFDSAGWISRWPRVSREDLQTVTQLYRAMEAVPANVQLAARRAMRAVMRTDDEDQTLDAAIGLEALLLGNNDRAELTHRMALRAAAALAPEYPSAEIFRLIKKFYEHRSAIVHGGNRKTGVIVIGEELYAPQEVGGYLLRVLLMNLLLAPVPWTPETLDTLIISSLMHSEP
jgi:Apea-like HEPN